MNNDIKKEFNKILKRQNELKGMVDEAIAKLNLYNLIARDNPERLEEMFVKVSDLLVDLDKYKQIGLEIGIDLDNLSKQHGEK